MAGPTYTHLTVLLVLLTFLQLALCVPVVVIQCAVNADGTYSAIFPRQDHALVASSPIEGLVKREPFFQQLGSILRGGGLNA